MKELLKRLGGGLYLDLRQQMEMSKHRRVARLCRRDIDRLHKGEISVSVPQPKQDFGRQTIIWQYWGQGWHSDTLPEVVRLCAQSVDRYKGDCVVVRLSDETISDYIDLPSYVYEKRKKNFSLPFFSDLLRIALLATYGGVWLDATILLTRQFPSEYLNRDFFAYQRSIDEPDQNFWRSSYYPYYGWNKNFRVRLLSSIIFSKARIPLMCSLLSLLYTYWEEQDNLIDYFYLHICFHELVSMEYQACNSLIESDCPPHIVQIYLTGGSYSRMTMREALELLPMHKLTYKGVQEDKLRELKEILNITS